MKLPRILLCLVTGAAAVTLTAAPPQNVLTEDQKQDGWRLLFDGKTLNGWRGYGDAEMAAAWSVKKGLLSLKGGNPHGSYINIITEDQFDDFVLIWDWRLEPGANSGLMFHVQEGPPMPYLTGPEYQMVDDKNFRDGKGNPLPKNEHSGGHYAIEAAYEDVMKPAGKWNRSRIRVKGNQVEYWLNGTKTAEYVMHSDEWNAQVAAAKFGRWKLYGTKGKGHIALQDHGQGAQFRNIRIKAL